MFSVNNFYDIFNSHYGWPRKNNNLWVFAEHGSKNWFDIANYGTASTGLFHGALIMHDQEPFFKESLDAFRGDLLASPGYITSSHWYRSRISNVAPDSAAINKDFVKTLTSAESLTYYIRSSEIPIFCHSERNSADIRFLEQNNYISCYYWWHGMVARDWYRHWERHADLTVYNKANAENKFIFYCRATCGTRSYRTKIKQYLKDYSVLGSENNAGSELSATINVADANKSAIHIVAETLFDTNKLYVTEKVFKPIVMAQPFIVFGAPGILQYLKGYGFKTFDSIWDEGYDTVVDANIRSDAILKLITNLSQLSSDQFYHLYNCTLPIIQFNRDYFFSQEFQNLLWNELTTNMDVALAQQQDLKDLFPGGTDFYHYNNYVNQGYTLSAFANTYLNNVVASGITTQDRVSNRYPVLSKLLS